jgi:glycosyltransferase involved in cell wall biosynthesis
MHGWDENRRIPATRALLYRWMGRATAAMAAVSLETAEEFARETGIPVSRFSVLSSGVDTARFVPGQAPLPSGDRPLVIGCVARLAPIKGLSHLLSAFREVHARQSSRLELRIIGDGPLREELVAEALQLGLGEAVRFPGNCTDVEKQLGRMDLFVLPSLREGRPTSIMEAMSTGLPIVATRVGSVERLVDDGECGLIVPPGDPPALAAALARFIADPGFRLRAGEAARTKAVREFSLDKMAEDYAEFYRKILALESRIHQTVPVS